MKNFYRILLILALALVLTVGAVSLVSWKQTEGVSEKTVEPPQFSLKALFDGTFIPQFGAAECGSRYAEIICGGGFRRDVGPCGASVGGLLPLDGSVIVCVPVEVECHIHSLARIGYGAFRRLQGSCGCTTQGERQQVYARFIKPLIALSSIVFPEPFCPYKP